MELKLTNPQDIIDYLDYLNDNNKLHSYFSELTVPSDEICNFLTYVKVNLDHSVELEQSAKTINRDPGYHKLLGSRHWTEDEVATLESYIELGLEIGNIATTLNRTPDAVRHKAYKALGYKYSSPTSTWTLTTK